MQQVRHEVCVDGLPKSERSIGDLFRELATESGSLLRKEVALAKAEMTEKAVKTARNAGYIAAGGVVAYAGALALLAAASIGLSVILAKTGVSSAEHAAYLGPLIVGAIVAVIGYAMIQKGISTLKNERLAPTKTTQSLRETKQWMQDRMTPSRTTV
jgi:hypothetical protein